jgi:hypothetical protein
VTSPDVVVVVAAAAAVVVAVKKVNILKFQKITFQLSRTNIIKSEKKS